MERIGPSATLGSPELTSVWPRREPARGSGHRLRRWSTGAIGLLAFCFAAPAAHAGKKLDIPTFQVAYRHVLEVYADGDSERALTRLMETETAAAGRRTNDEIERMWKAKLGVIRDLIGVDRDALLPIALFHQSAYRAYGQRGQLPLAIHSRTMAVELVDFYAKKSDRQAGRRVAAGLLASLAGDLEEGHMSETAAVLYAQALQIDPTNETALLHLAVMLEKRGDYAGALDYLDRLAREHPDNLEARLRRGLNLARIGDTSGALFLLQEIIRSDGVPPWVLAVAHQELARLRVRQGQPEVAMAGLRAALETLPGDPTLPILLAYYNDRFGHRGDGPDLLASFAEQAAEHEPAPRFRYSRRPRRALSTLRRRLESACHDRMPVLSRALAATASTAAMATATSEPRPGR